MNTRQLEEYMMKDPYILNMYGGVVAIDQIPHQIVKPSLFIVNSDPIAFKGEHWEVLYFDKINEHFDSVGLEPHPVLETHLITNGPKYRFNSKRVQNYHTNSCGLFCLFFCYFRARAYSFIDIMDMLGNNLELNEDVVNYFYGLTM